MKELVRESREWFVGLVAERRELSPNDLVPIRTGRIYSGRQALKVGLIDQIGGEDDALVWLKAERGIADDIEIVDWAVENPSESSFFMKGLAGIAGSIFGIQPERISWLIGDASSLNQLDGLVSLWHPAR